MIFFGLNEMSFFRNEILNSIVQIATYYMYIILYDILYDSYNMTI